MPEPPDAPRPRRPVSMSLPPCHATMPGPLPPSVPALAPGLWPLWQAWPQPGPLMLSQPEVRGVASDQGLGV